jgi:N6-L-threonylcarbamoyladenine synthase
MLREENINNFSFSGLKTAIWREWNKLKVQDEAAADAVAFSVQETITDVLVEKTIRAAEEIGAASVLLSGGVSANLRLREKFLEKLSSLAIPLLVPPVALCTDNAAYIGSYAYFRGKPADWQSVTAVPDLSVEVQS